MYRSKLYYMQTNAYISLLYHKIFRITTVFLKKFKIYSIIYTVHFLFIKNTLKKYNFLTVSLLTNHNFIV